MKLLNVFDEVFKEEDYTVYLNEDEIISENIFLTPLVAFMAFKDNVVKKIEKIDDKVKKPYFKVAGEVEKAKANLGINGKSKDSTVYTFTKEQRDFLTYIYKKYGKKVIKDIRKFRNNVMAPYQVVKRYVANNKTLTDKEVNGMTKEEYDRYRESGAKKIKRMATKDSDFDKSYEEHINIKSEKNKLIELYKQAEEGKGTINYSQIEKILTKLGLGVDDFSWPLEELRRTFRKIVELENDIKKSDGDRVVLSVRKNGVKYISKKQAENDVKYLKEFGYSAFTNSKSKDTKQIKKDFKEDFQKYIVRNSKKENIESDFIKNPIYKKMYIDALKDEVDNIEKRFKGSLSVLNSYAKNYELNEYEKKIWGLKLTGNKKSGDIKDWYLKIQPSDFSGNKYYQKSDLVKKAEKDIDKELKAFERKMKKVISEEDWKLLIKHRLVNNFLTISELRSKDSMFKSDEELDKLSKIDYNLLDFKDEIDECLNKDFKTFKELEQKKRDLTNKSNLFFGKEKEEAKKHLAAFLNRGDIGDKDNKDASLLISSIEKLVKKIDNTEYSNYKIAEGDLRELENKISQFKEEHSDEVFKLNSINYSIEKVKDKLNKFIKSRRED